MDTECYEKCISDELISDVRLKQLERITDERLLSAVQMMRREKKSGYQGGAFCKETTCQYEGTSCKIEITNINTREACYGKITYPSRRC